MLTTLPATTPSGTSLPRREISKSERVLIHVVQSLTPHVALDMYIVNHSLLPCKGNAYQSVSDMPLIRILLRHYRHLVATKKLPEGVVGMCLETTGVVRKYTGYLDIFWSAVTYACVRAGLCLKVDLVEGGGGFFCGICMWRASLETSLLIVFRTIILSKIILTCAKSSTCNV